MNKHDLVNALREEYGLSWKESSNYIGTLLESIKKGLHSGKPVTIQNFGTFTIKKLSAKKYRDIKTGRIKTTGIRTKVKFIPSPHII